MKNEIVLQKETKTMLVVGPLAHTLYHAHKKELNTLFEIQHLEAWVYEPSGTLRAAQSTINSAVEYMNENRILVYKE